VTDEKRFELLRVAGAERADHCGCVHTGCAGACERITRGGRAAVSMTYGT